MHTTHTIIRIGGIGLIF
uniref:Uncharacterized protein n=1 Tax=Anguilla anguilla TaxID=7936 RepID=A0A0E9SCR4_ANGAN